jgi:hypothetical protein
MPELWRATAAFVKVEPDYLGEAGGGDCENIGSLRVKR